MGSCLSNIKKDSSDSNIRRNLSNLVTNRESYLANLVFNDLANRSLNRRITKIIFIEFYHLNGLWGEAVFHQFDKNKSGQLTSEQFIQVITLLAKGNQNQKLKILFTFYDIDHKGNINSSQLLKMVWMYQQPQFYSYPKQQLYQILNDEGFKKTLVANTNFQQASRQQQLQNFDKQIENLQGRQQNKSLKQQQKKNLKNEFRDLTEKEKEIEMNLVKVQTLEKNKFKNKICNITYLLKKYVQYLFNDIGLINTEQSISYEQFKLLVNKHKKLSYFYFQGFHNYLWEYTNNKPMWNVILPDKEGEVQYKIITPQKDIKQSKYLKLIKSAILIFEKKEDDLPIQIIILNGLQIQKYEYKSHIRQEYGFKINHHDRYYLQKIYLVSNKEQQQSWMQHLKFFQSKKINDKYQIREKIGAGNFSVVYKCQNKITKQIFSLKQIKKLNLLKIQFDLICNQIDIISHCHCPYIIRYLQKFENKTHIYLITQYIKDGDLFNYIISKNKLSEYEACLVMQQILLSIKYMNQLGLIHRDLKPENIMIIKNEQKNLIHQIKIIDFGFAIYLNTLKYLNLTQKCVGTPNYTAPEVFFANGNYDQKIDLYSAGVILYLMLTGTLPHNGKSTGQICHSLLTKKVNYQNDIWKDISLDAKQLTRSLLNQNPETRISVNLALQSSWIINSGNNQLNNKT